MKSNKVYTIRAEKQNRSNHLISSSECQKLFGARPHELIKYYLNSTIEKKIEIDVPNP
jgi:hypothetical protein